MDSCQSLHKRHAVILPLGNTTPLFNATRWPSGFLQRIAFSSSVTNPLSSEERPPPFWIQITVLWINVTHRNPVHTFAWQTL